MISDEKLLKFIYYILKYNVKKAKKKEKLMADLLYLEENVNSDNLFKIFDLYTGYTQYFELEELPDVIKALAREMSNE